MLRVLGLAAVSLLASVPLSAIELKGHTLDAWNRYVKLTESRIRDEVGSADRFLIWERKFEDEGARLRRALHAGKVEVEQLATLDLGSPFKVRDGLVHHWIGSVLVPDTPIDRVLQVVQDYDHYAERFAPMITRSRIVERRGDEFEVHMRTAVKRLKVEVTLDQEFQVRYERLSPTRVFATTKITRIRQVDNPDTPSEVRVDGDDAFGWMWRMNTYCSFDQRAEGTYQQCESLTLTRTLPVVVAWAGPMITNMSRESLETSLLQVRRTFER